eukprot:scaffold4326_cov121-Cylindrotheca_fusiformis.AAC.1
MKCVRARRPTTTSRANSLLLEVNGEVSCKQETSSEKEPPPVRRGREEKSIQRRPCLARI